MKYLLSIIVYYYERSNNPIFVKLKLGVAGVPKRIKSSIEKIVNCIAKKEEGYFGVARNQIASINVSFYKYGTIEKLKDELGKRSFPKNTFNQMRASGKVFAQKSIKSQ